jgi:hypothetical protein
MRRARHNVALLVERLHAFGYRFVYPEEVWTSPHAQQIAVLDTLERRYGPLPLSLRAWYEIVGSINLMGAHPRLNSYAGLDAGAARSPIYGDPLVLERLPEDLLPFYEGYAEDDEEIAGPPYALDLAPDAVHKSNYSGGSPTQIMLPSPAADAPLLSDEWDGLPFVAYLRICFHWGGFPGLGGEWWLRHSPQPGVDQGQAQAELAYLTKDLLPI